MDRTSDFGSDSEGSNPSAVTNCPFLGAFLLLYPLFPKNYPRGFLWT